MNECLITKLKSSVDDTSLQKLGVVSFIINSDSSVEEKNRQIVFSAIGGCEIRTPQGYPIVSFTNGNRISNNVVGFNSGNITCVLSAGYYEFEITNKYSIETLNSASNSRNANFDYNFTKNSYLIGLKNLYFNPNIITKQTKIEDIFKCCPNIESFNMSEQNFNDKVIGEMSDFALFKNINSISILSGSGIKGGGVTGTLESYIESAVRMGKKDGVVDIVARGTYIKFNGQNFASSVSGGSNRYKLFCVFSNEKVQVYGNAEGTYEQGDSLLGEYLIANNTWNYPTA